MLRAAWKLSSSSAWWRGVEGGMQSRSLALGETRMLMPARLLHQPLPGREKRAARPAHHLHTPHGADRLWTWGPGRPTAKPPTGRAGGGSHTPASTSQPPTTHPAPHPVPPRGQTRPAGRPPTRRPGPPARRGAAARRSRPGRVCHPSAPSGAPTGRPRGPGCPQPRPPPAWAPRPRSAPPPGSRPGTPAPRRRPAGPRPAPPRPRWRCTGLRGCAPRSPCP
ncbi:hypothetical protein F751_4908 [Auxenochlorella protothecoides]|uniref:Uncharacterized protein n=1 Tax=Auxenochlorella protothecoides TaxID=3075 RepID=A0A087SL11_AUXPR|nr:hypothetical protein F751_4908 [Auxenochlorella protothecoides]KFM26415.1 hypothetical protein F751_4908 [Auxenochlorella protothecoides]